MGTTVVPTFPTHPLALAAQALTTSAATGGRLALGLGLSHRSSVEGRWGLRYEQPIRHLLDDLDVLQPVLASGVVNHRGAIWSGSIEAPRPTTSPPALLLAALSPQTLRICGRRTDGTVLWLVGPKTIATHIAPALHAAAGEVGRPPTPHRLLAPGRRYRRRPRRPAAARPRAGGSCRSSGLPHAT